MSDTDSFDNDELLTHRGQGEKVGSRFTLSVCLLLTLSMCAFWLISNYNTQNLLRQQADQLGDTVATQTALQKLCALSRISRSPTKNAVKDGAQKGTAARKSSPLPRASAGLDP